MLNFGFLNILAFIPVSIFLFIMTLYALPIIIILLLIMILSRGKAKWYAKNILISLDQLGNTITGGHPDETISSRAGKAQKENKWWACKLCKFLHRWDEAHCEKSIELDEGNGNYG